MAKPVKEDYSDFEETCVFKPTARELEILSRCCSSEELGDILLMIDRLKEKVECLEIRFNELCKMLSVQLANSGFETLRIE